MHKLSLHGHPDVGSGRNNWYAYAFADRPQIGSWQVPESHCGAPFEPASVAYTTRFPSPWKSTKLPAELVLDSHSFCTLAVQAPVLVLNPGRQKFNSRLPLVFI